MYDNNDATLDSTWQRDSYRALRIKYDKESNSNTVNECTMIRKEGRCTYKEVVSCRENSKFIAVPYGDLKHQ